MDISQTAAALESFVLDHLEVAVILLDPSGAVIAQSRAARSLEPELARLFDAPIRDREILELLEQARAAGTATLERSREDDGRPRLARLDASVTDGAIVVVIRDVTAERAREDELRHLRTIETIGLVTASLVHDLNNLLTLVLCGSAVLARKLDAPSAELAVSVEDAAGRAAALVRDMLGLARGQAPTVGPVDVADVLARMRPILERLLGDVARLDVASGAPVGSARLDRSRLEHAMINLIVNARDAIAHQGTVAIELGEEDGEIVIRVSDDGVGMTPEVRARVLDRFYTTKPWGTGLGLASVDTFVRESGGSIAIDSEPRRGTVVTLRLPRIARDEAQEVPARAPRASSEHRGAGVILVVDRSADARLASRVVLEARGHSVIDTPSAAAALSAARASERPIALAIVDAGLTASSPSLLEELGAITPSLPIVLTAPAGERRLGDRIDACTRGRVVHKAFSEEELVRAVETALERR
jgi:signal transduction histidine kinase/CheY-like chemotaxis protein